MAAWAACPGPFRLASSGHCRKCNPDCPATGWHARCKEGSLSCGVLGGPWGLPASTKKWHSGASATPKAAVSKPTRTRGTLWRRCGESLPLPFNHLSPRAGRLTGQQKARRLAAAGFHEGLAPAIYRGLSLPGGMNPRRRTLRADRARSGDRRGRLCICRAPTCA